MAILFLSPFRLAEAPYPNINHHIDPSEAVSLRAKEGSVILGQLQRIDMMRCIISILCI